MSIETPLEQLNRMERDGIIDLWCGGCSVFYQAVDEGKFPSDVFSPSHRASARCESGKRAHCTCDRCF